MAVTTEANICTLAMNYIGANAVENIDSPTTDEEKACSQVFEHERDLLLGISTHNWAFAKRTLMLNPADGYEENYFDAVDISGISQADPGVVTATSHGFTDGWLVQITGVAGMTQINDRIVRVANKAANTFECYGLRTDKFDAYTSGGEVVRYEAAAYYQEGYVYDVPADLIKPVMMDDLTAKWEMIEGGNGKRIISNSEDAVLHYIAQVTTVSEMSNEFKEALASRIAYVLSTRFAKTATNKQELYQQYHEHLSIAIAADSRKFSLNTLVRDVKRISIAGGWTS